MGSRKCGKALTVERVKSSWLTNRYLRSHLSSLTDRQRLLRWGLMPMCGSCSISANLSEPQAPQLSRSFCCERKCAHTLHTWSRPHVICSITKHSECLLSFEFGLWTFSACHGPVSCLSSSNAVLLPTATPYALLPSGLGRMLATGARTLT